MKYTAVFLILLFYTGFGLFLCILEGLFRYIMVFYYPPLWPTLKSGLRDLRGRQSTTFYENEIKHFIY